MPNSSAAACSSSRAGRFASDGETKVSLLARGGSSLPSALVLRARRGTFKGAPNSDTYELALRPLPTPTEPCWGWGCGCGSGSGSGMTSSSAASSSKLMLSASLLLARRSRCGRAAIEGGGSGISVLKLKPGMVSSRN